MIGARCAPKFNNENEDAVVAKSKRNASTSGHLAIGMGGRNARVCCVLRLAVAHRMARSGRRRRPDCRVCVRLRAADLGRVSSGIRGGGMSANLIDRVTHSPHVTLYGRHWAECCQSGLGDRGALHRYCESNIAGPMTLLWNTNSRGASNANSGQAARR